MSDIKMSDVFGSSINEDPISRIVTSLILFGPEKDAAIKAISQHDALVEQNKSLRAALLEECNKVTDLIGDTDDEMYQDSLDKIKALEQAQ